MADLKSISTIVGPLNFSESSKQSTRSDENEIAYLSCSKLFSFPSERDIYLAHLFLTHKIVISDEQQIALLDEYLSHWHKQFQDKNVANPLEEYCTTLLLNHLPDGTPAIDEKYYLLSDVLPRDYELRKNLHLKRLEQVLTQHQFERTDQTFKRECLHCRDVVTPTRANFIEHLFAKHFLQLGKSENLVFIDELIDNVQEKLEKLICLFCSKKFKDRPTLKEHMRKKGHKRINPENKKYDKFFLVNYKNEMDQPKGNRQNTAKQSVRSTMLNSMNISNKPTASQSDSDSDWEDWEGEKQNLNCLFCSMSDTDFVTIKSHMKANHDIDFEAAIAGLNFYEKVKVVNYIRRQVHMLKCVSCGDKFDTIKLLHDHLTSSKHYGIGNKSDWDHPEFFFPTYEDDSFLCYLDDPNDNSCSTEDAVVISEEPIVSVNLNAEKLSKENDLSCD